MSILTCCSTEIDIDDYVDNSKPIELTVRSKNDSVEFIGRPEILLTADSEKFKKLIDWGTKNVEGWESAIASYVMADAYLIQDDFHFGYYKSGFVILNFKDKEGNPRQVKKQVDHGDLDFLFD